MSKFAGLAGMRVGYGLFPRMLVPFPHHVTPPFHNISVASALAAIASLEDLDYLKDIRGPDRRRSRRAFRSASGNSRA